MNFEFEPKGICASLLSFDVNGGKVFNVKFIGGCQGNQIGIARLVEGMMVEDVIERLEGISCGGKGTSCPNVLAQELKNFQGET